MGATPLFPLFIAIFLLGIAALNQNYAESVQKPSASSEAQLQAGSFLSYRQTVTTYLVAHPGSLSQVPVAHLNAQGISSAVQAQIGHAVVANGSTRQLVVFSQLANGFEVFRASENDAAIGIVKTGQFVPFLIGGLPTPLPMTLPEGYVVSFVDLGN